eukprot:SAG22_NODE_899_length_6616_cov_2.845634_2_plen_101_part_00
MLRSVDRSGNVRLCTCNASLVLIGVLSPNELMCVCSKSHIDETEAISITISIGPIAIMSPGPILALKAPTAPSYVHSPVPRQRCSLCSSSRKSANLEKEF